MGAVNYSLDSGVATISMNDGKANIMNTELLTELIQAFNQARADNAAVLLRSELPQTYSAGFDTKVFARLDPQSSLAMVKAGGELLHTMLSLPRPTLAVATGHIFPMGLFTLLACDCRIGAEADYQWCLNEVELGIVPPLYAFKLVEARLARPWPGRALCTGTRFSARQGLEAGLFHELLPPSACEPHARELIARLAGHSAQAYAGIKQRLNSDLASDIQASIASEQTLSHYESMLEAG